MPSGSHSWLSQGSMLVPRGARRAQGASNYPGNSRKCGKTFSRKRTVTLGRPASGFVSPPGPIRSNQRGVLLDLCLPIYTKSFYCYIRSYALPGRGSWAAVLRGSGEVRCTPQNIAIDLVELTQTTPRGQAVLGALVRWGAGAGAGAPVQRRCAQTIVKVASRPFNELVKHVY